MKNAKTYIRIGLLALLSLSATLWLGAQTKSKGAGGRSVLYAANGPELIQYDVDVEKATLTKRDSVMLPQLVQEAWLHPSHKYLYVTWSNGVTGSTVPADDKSPHGTTAYSVDPATGALHQLGEPLHLAERAVYTTVDIDGTHIITAYNDPSNVTVHTIKPDGSLGVLVPPGGKLDTGVYAHMTRVDPSNRAVIVVTRGNAPTPTKKEDPGAIKVYSYKSGVLTNKESVAPNGGYNFQFRHLDFHPSGKWVYLTLERQNKLAVFTRSPDGTLGETPLYSKDPLASPVIQGRAQSTSSIHFHPNGKFIYVANRGTGTVDYKGQKVFAGGENTIAVFSVNPETGEPTLVQTADTHGFHPRTFAIDPTGHLLVVANMVPMKVKDESGGVTTVAACLSVLRIGDDGRLTFVRKYDLETPGNRTLFWTGFVPLPAK